MSIIVRFIVISCFCLNVLAEQYSYINVSDIRKDDTKTEFGNYQNVISIDTGKKVVYSGHTFSKYEDCGNDKWICIFGDPINFAIPKISIEEKEQWKFKNFRFKRMELPVNFVESETLHKIGVFDGDNETNFMIVLYSKRRGVVGFSILYKEVTETYWLLNEKGLGVN